jgi:dipeptidyl aminopeptidase/acylaminoacyl peptidase
VTDLAGATLRRIADGTSPAWSPDGSKIAYISTYLWQAGADGTDPTMIWTCGAGSSSVVSCSLSDVGWSRDGRLISFVEERSDGKESSLHVVVIDAASRAMTFSTEGSAPRWVAGSNRLAFIRTENFGFYSTYPMPYDYWSSYAKLCVITLPDGTCASLPIGHGDVLSYDVGL